MKILLVPKPGVDLYRTLYDSETSRAILRFYRPSRHPWGVEITTSSLGSALSLISELRWYVQRYIQEVLIEVADGVVISRALAREVYQRNLTLTSPWPHRMRFRMERGRIRRSLVEEREPAVPAHVPEPVQVPMAEPGTAPEMQAPVPGTGSTEPEQVHGGTEPPPVAGTPETEADPATRELVPLTPTPDPAAIAGSPQLPPAHAQVSPEALTIEVWTTPDEPVEDVVAEEEPVAAEGEAGGEPPEASGETGKEGG